MLVVVPYHLDERLDPFAVGAPVDREVVADLPADAGTWERLAVLYDRVAAVVAEAVTTPTVVSGDCTTSLAVLAGLQRAGREPAIVWLDAHADFHTEATTTSGYLGGLPLALATGTGALMLPAALGLRPVAQDRVVLVDARDTDPPEQQLLAATAVRRVAVVDLVEGVLPAGDLYLHLDVDVADPQDVPGLLYPVPGGPSLPDVLAAVRRVVATGRVAAVGLGTTWHQDGDPRHGQVVRALLAALEGRPQVSRPAG